MSDHEFDDLVNTIYESLMDEDLLDTVPSALADYCGARSASLLICKSPTELEKMLAVDYFPSDLWVEYQQHFTDKDLWRLRLAALPANQVHDLVPEHISEREFLGSEMYNDLARKYGDDTVHCMGAHIPLPNGCMAVIGLHRALRAGHFDQRLQSRLLRTLPHLKRLVTLWRMFGGTARRAELSEAVLDTLSTCVMVLDSIGRVVYQNHAATAVLQQGDGLRCSEGQLIGTQFEITQALQASIRQLIFDPTGNATTALRIPRPSGASDYCVLLAPLRRQIRTLQGKILVALENPDSSLHTQSEHLATLFGLTPAESQVAMRLAEGRSAEEIAQENHVAMSTVRSQTKAILAKTETNRQSELVSLITKLPRVQ